MSRKHRHRQGAAPKQWHRRPDRESPISSAFGVCGRGRAHVERPVTIAEGLAQGRSANAAAGVLDDAEFAAKPALVTQMVTAALNAGRPAAGDEVYGADPDLHRRLQQRSIGYVVGIGANCVVTIGTERVDVLYRLAAACLTAPLSWGGARADRWYSWRLSASPRTTPTAPAVGQ